jgi:two-component system, cell cycle sensor histidine kinase DivJ
LRINETMSVIEGRLAGLVHESVQDDPFERLQHERFIVTRILTGVIALSCLPPYLLWRGVPSLPEYIAIACLVAPVLAAVVLSRTGRLALAHGVSSVALAGFIVCIAATSGGVASAATVWLVAIPLEALLSGSGRAALWASAVAVLSALFITTLDTIGVLPASDSWPMAMAMPVFAITAIGHAAALAIQHARFEGGRRAMIRARDARDRSLLQAIDDLVTWHDKNGHVLKASAASAKLLGVPAASLAGRGLLARVHVSDRPAFLKAVSDAAESDQPVVVQFRLHVGSFGDRAREEGSATASFDARKVVWAETRAHRIETPHAPASDGYAVVAVTRDVTEHKRHADDLDRARSEAEQADASKGRFLATVSHELRTPLNAIIGFSEMLSAEGIMAIGPERRREYAQIVRDSGLHLLAVVNTLLDMSKIEAGRFDFVPEPFDVAPVVHSCCDLLQLKAEQAGIVILRDIARDLPEFIADGRACKQILINLLSNAVKFTPPGGRVSVAVRRDGDRIAFTVADTGIGIAESDLPKLGEPFFQASSRYARAYEGTGLGLSVVRGLVGLHNGDLTVESAIGEGTSVTVRLPIDCRTGKIKPAGGVRFNAFPRRPANANLLQMG